MVLGAVGAQVLDGGEALLDAAVEPGVRAHLVGRLAHGAVAHAQDEEDRQAEVDEHPEAEPPVEDGQHAEHARQHDRRPGDLGHDLGQEVGHVGDVAVDALDQLARRVLAVELVVEAEDVAGDVEAQPVGDPPRRHRRRPHDDDVEHLGDDGDDEEQDPEADDDRGRRAVGGLVDDAADDQRAGERAGRRRGDERAEDRPPAGIRPDQRRQGAPARRRCLRHACSLAARAGGSAVGFSAIVACSAIDAAPTMPASFSSDATTISASTSTYVQPLVGLATDAAAEDQQVG